MFGPGRHTAQHDERNAEAIAAGREQPRTIWLAKLGCQHAYELDRQQDWHDEPSLVAAWNAKCKEMEGR